MDLRLLQVTNTVQTAWKTDVHIHHSSVTFLTKENSLTKLHTAVSFGEEKKQEITEITKDVTVKSLTSHPDTNMHVKHSVNGVFSKVTIIFERDGLKRDHLMFHMF